LATVVSHIDSGKYFSSYLGDGSFTTLCYKISRPCEDFQHFIETQHN